MITKYISKRVLGESLQNNFGKEVALCLDFVGSLSDVK
jgi:hypothetical protein